MGAECFSSHHQAADHSCPVPTSGCAGRGTGRPSRLFHGTSAGRSQVPIEMRSACDDQQPRCYDGVFSQSSLVHAGRSSLCQQHRSDRRSLFILL